MRTTSFPGRLGLQQRILPAYRMPFFDALAVACAGGLGVFAGKPLPEESIAINDRLQVARFFPARNRNFFPIHSPLYQCWQAGLLPWLEEWQPDALIVEASPRNASTRLAIRWMHARGRPVLGWGLGAPGMDGRINRWRQSGRLSLLRSLDGIIAYSRQGAEEYRALVTASQHIFVAPNAVSPRPSAPSPQRPHSFDGQPVVLFVGRLQTRKRIDDLIKACAALPGSLQPRLWVVGDGPARKELQALAESIYPFTEFLGAHHGPGLVPIFGAADLFVLPGTGGLAVQHAMTYGLPVIVAEGDGTQSNLVRPENGWLVSPGDVNALSSVLKKALSDPPRLRRMGKASFQIVYEEINLEAMVEAFVGALNALCKG
jgi:glycosyltransferase involved in cell wall biosynthesis